MLIPTIAFCFLFITNLMKLHNRYLMNIKKLNICEYLHFHDHCYFFIILLYKYYKLKYVLFSS